LLPHSARLTERRSFERVYQSGIYYVAPAVTLHVLKKDAAEPTKTGVVASRKLGVIARRNRQKRRIRAICRALLHSIKPGYDLVWVARPALIEINAERLARQMRTLLKQGSVLSETVDG
jgi:ribonuclease P protein component